MEFHWAERSRHFRRAAIQTGSSPGERDPRML